MALRSALWLAVAGWAAVIFSLSHQSTPLGQSAGGAESIGAHLTLYAVLSALLCWALAGGVRLRPARWLLSAIVFALTVLYGVSDEVHQAFIAGRSASELDLALDALGALLGLAAVLLLDAALKHTSLRPR